MTVSSSSENVITAGEMLNLMTVDCDKIFNFILKSTMLFSCPLRIVIVLIFLWHYLGPSCLAGLAVIAFIVPITLLLARVFSSIHEKQMICKDTRLKHMKEILNSIKVLKFNAWEMPFINKISDVREKEVAYIKSFLYCYSGSSFLWNCAPFLVSVACFVTYILVDESHVLSPNIVFVSLNLLNILKFTLLYIPHVIADLVQSNISLNRIQSFLSNEDRNEADVGFHPGPGVAITFQNVNLTWEKQKASVLCHIDLQVPNRALVAVVGPVGSGKSSLLSSILGDMHRLSGSIELKGTIAYVPQQAWILNATLKENILLGKAMDANKYANVLERCCLLPDLKLLPAGDMTEIGEKGTNLSGGQKQRVSLARAVLQDADIYLLDDPLSAVDHHVGNSLFEDVIGNKGLLKDKTRILVTHNESILPRVDLIVSMRGGTIEKVGKYENMDVRSGLVRNAINGRIKMEKNRKHLKVRRNKITKSFSKDSLFEAIANKLVKDENMEIGGITFKIYTDYMRHLSFNIGLPLIFFYMCYQAFEIGTNVWLANWSNDVPLPDGTQDLPLRNFRVAIFAGFGLAQALCIVLRNILLAIGVSKSSSKYHKLMLLSVLKSPMSFFDTTPTGRIINRFSRDLEVINSEIPIQFDGFMACLFVVIGTIIIIGISTPMFLVFIIPIAIFYYFVQKFYLRISRQIRRLDSITRSPVYSHFQETIEGVSSIRAYGVKEDFIKAFEEKLDTNFTCYFNWDLCNRWLSVRLDFLSNAVVLIVTLFAIEHRNSVDAALLGLTLLYSITLTDSLTYLVTSSSDLEIKSISLERINEYCNLESEGPWNVPDDDPPSTWPAYGAVKFIKYGSRYREELHLALNGLNFEISSNEKIGLSGRTGSGKSSVTLALFRMIEAAEGSIVIDGVDISKIGLHSLRSKLTIIPQEPVLFCGTLRTNLDPHHEYDDQALWSSLERAHLKEFVSSLSDGLNHEISEGGENISVGQRQLVCLSRALLKKSKILILDEATAAIDTDMDRLIQQTIREEFRNHTVITISHRLNTIMDYDRIIIMDSGKIEEIGNVSELLNDPNSRFYLMAKEAHLL